MTVANKTISNISPELMASLGERVLVIDDEENVASALQAILHSSGYSVETAPGGREALELLEESDFDLILCDLKMPEMDGIEFLKLLNEKEHRSTVIMMSAFGTVETTLETIKLGAYDYIAKPFNSSEILLTIKKAQERERLRFENEMLKSQVAKRYSLNNIIAKSAPMMEIFDVIKKIADYKTTILLHGESGTGKELVARAIHHNSVRRNKRFIAINCGAIPENLLESELFGHKRGSFTDAQRDKKGLFEEADGGTLLLDEIGELPLHLQVKILRVLQENEIRPVGDSRSIPINVRVIAATLRDLEADVLDGRFRDDLFYRLNVINLRVPPLRERKEDIPLLINHFVKRNQERLGLSVYGVSKEAVSILMDHDWPGNIRELENCIERAMILTEGNEISVESLPRTVRPAVEDTPSNLNFSEGEMSIKKLSRELEETLIKRALEKTKGNRTHAAKILEISHRTLLYKLKQYGLAEGSGDDESK